jgi:TonB family protein
MVAAFEIEESITIGATTFEANPVQLHAPLMRGSERALADRPTFVAYTHAPELTNREEVIYHLSELYPHWARKARVRESVLLYLFIDEQGAVQRTVLVESSGHDDFDNAAVEVAKQMVWTPALNRDRATPVWLM